MEWGRLPPTLSFRKESRLSETQGRNKSMTGPSIRFASLFPLLMLYGVSRCARVRSAFRLRLTGTFNPDRSVAS